jgi:hypothetical protein
MQINSFNEAIEEIKFINKQSKNVKIMNGQKITDAILAETDAQLKSLYKVKDIVMKHLHAGNPYAAGAELQVFFGTMFTPELFKVQNDKEELLKQANKLLAKSELYTWNAFESVFRGIAVALNDVRDSKTPFDEGYRTLYLLLKNATSVPPFLVKRIQLTEEVCNLYSAPIRKALLNEFGEQIKMVFNTDGTIYDPKLYQQVVDYVRRHTPNVVKDELEQKQFPAFLVEIALKGMKAFAFPTEK